MEKYDCTRVGLSSPAKIETPATAPNRRFVVVVLPPSSAPRGPAFAGMHARAGHSTTAATLHGSKSVLLVFGGFDGQDVIHDLQMFAPSEEPAWHVLDTVGMQPAPRAMHAAAMLDDRRLVVHGGWGGGEDVLRADTCILHLPQSPDQVAAWDAPCSNLSIVEGPTPRQGHTLVAAAACEVLLFGGDVGLDVSGELWSLTADPGDERMLLWRPVAPSGAPPDARSGHAACAAPGGLMLIFGGRAADGSSLGDLFLFATGTRRWSQPKVTGDVPRPRWAAACCALPAGGPHGTRLLIDGGRDADGWIGTQTLIDAVDAPSAPPASGGGSTDDDPTLELRCHAVQPGGHKADKEDGSQREGAHAAARPLAGHCATPCGGSAWIVGGSFPNGELSGDTQKFVGNVVRWVCPSAGMLGLKFTAGRDGHGAPQLFPELIGPPLLASTHTATRCGDFFYVLGGHEPPAGKLAQRGGGLLLAVLHVPSLSWMPRYEALHPHAPKLKSGHSAVLLPGAGGIAVLGGVRSNAPWGAGAETRLSNELHVLKIGRKKAVAQQRGGGGEADPSSASTEIASDSPPDLDGEPTRWSKAGGAFFTTAPGWPTPCCGHAAVALPAPYGWSHGNSSQGAMLVVGGYSVDPYTPDGPEGALSATLHLLRPAEESWLQLTPTGTSPTPRMLHSATLLAPSGAAFATEQSAPLLRVCVFGGWGAAHSVVATSSVRIASARYLADLHLLTIDPRVEGACSWVQLRPMGIPPSPRAGAAAVPTADGGLLLLGGCDGGGPVSADRLEMCALPGEALQHAECVARGIEPRSAGASLQSARSLATSTADVLPPTAFPSDPGARIAWMWPDFVGQPPPAALRLSAASLGTRVLVLVPPSAAADGGAELGPTGEPGTALYLLAADGSTDAELQAQYQRVRQREAIVAQPQHRNKRVSDAGQSTSPRHAERSSAVPSSSPRISFGSATDTQRVPFELQRAGVTSKASEISAADGSDDLSAEHSSQFSRPTRKTAVGRPFSSTASRFQPMTRDAIDGPSAWQYAAEIISPLGVQTRDASARDAAIRSARVYLLPQAQRIARTTRRGMSSKVAAASRALPKATLASPRATCVDQVVASDSQDLRPPPYFAATPPQTPGPGAYRAVASMGEAAGSVKQPHAAWVSNSPRLQYHVASTLNEEAWHPQIDRHAVPPQKAAVTIVSTAESRSAATMSAPPNRQEESHFCLKLQVQVVKAAVQAGEPLTEDFRTRLVLSGLQRDDTVHLRDAAAPLASDAGLEVTRSSSARAQRPWRYWARDETRDNEQAVEFRKDLARRRCEAQLMPRPPADPPAEQSRTPRTSVLDALAQPRWKLQQPAAGDGEELLQAAVRAPLRAPRSSAPRPAAALESAVTSSKKAAQRGAAASEAHGLRTITSTTPASANTPIQVPPAWASSTFREESAESARLRVTSLRAALRDPTIARARPATAQLRMLAPACSPAAAPAAKASVWSPRAASARVRSSLQFLGGAELCL